MTNEEAIVQLGVDHYLFRSEINEKDVRPITKEDLEEFNIAIKAIEENSELKEEIEQLKAELEQSIKLPCNVGDVVYDNDFGYPSPSTIVGYSFGYVNQDDDLEIDLGQIYFYSKSNRYNIDMSFPASTIGESIFLTKEQAEQHLKGELK